MTSTEDTATATRRAFPSTPVTDHMIAFGYVPTGVSEGGEMFETYPGNGIVRVVTFAEDRDQDIWYALFVLTASQAHRYSAEFSPGTPPSVVLAAIRAAEAEVKASRL